MLDGALYREWWHAETMVINHWWPRHCLVVVTQRAGLWGKPPASSVGGSSHQIEAVMAAAGCTNDNTLNTVILMLPHGGGECLYGSLLVSASCFNIVPLVLPKGTEMYCFASLSGETIQEAVFGKRRWGEMTSRLLWRRWVLIGCCWRWWRGIWCECYLKGSAWWPVSTV